MRSASSTNMNNFDVIIIGGGIVGATTACALGREGVTVALVEARPPITDLVHTERDARVFAINRASQRILSALDVWGSIIAQDAYPFHEMRVWDAGGEGMIHFDCADVGEPYLGHMVEPRIIQAALTRQLQSIDTVTVFSPARFSTIDATGSQVGIELESGESLNGELLVAADGARSHVRECVGIRSRVHDYRQYGLVALVKTQHSHQATAWQRFLPGGPLAFLPMNDGWSSIVWTLPVADVEQVLEIDREAFHESLGQAFGFQLGAITDSGKREAYPLLRLHAEHYVQEHVALVGDAAHVIHPLAGQGVNLGLLDAAALVEVVVNARAAGKKPGQLSVLRRYERWRRGENLLMMSAMDGFNRLFSNTRPPLCWLRNMGLSLVDSAGPAKDVLARHAAGLTGDLPALARAVSE